MKAFIGVDKQSKVVCLIASLDDFTAVAEALADDLILVPCNAEQTADMLFKTLPDPFDLRSAH